MPVYNAGKVGRAADENATGHIETVLIHIATCIEGSKETPVLDGEPGQPIP